NPAGLILNFSSYIDDGAVFYLNGAEIFRNNMAPAPAIISNATFAAAYNCGGGAPRPGAFNISPDLFTHLVSGGNVLAVEVHNYTAGSAAIPFGSALSLSVPSSPPPRLKTLRSGDQMFLYWNGMGFSLQESSTLNPPVWMDVTDAAASPYST